MHMGRVKRLVGEWQLSLSSNTTYPDVSPCLFASETEFTLAPAVRPTR